MSKDSRKFQVPDELAHLYDFANSLDVRHFTHHGVQHVQGDELTGTRELAVWMSQRAPSTQRTKIPAVMFYSALQLRAGVRAYLECDPADRRKDNEAVRSLNDALKFFPL